MGHLVSMAGRYLREVGETCFDSQYFVPAVPQFFYKIKIYIYNIYIYILYIYIYMLVAGLQGWNHVSPDRPLTGLSCEVETAGPGCPGASRGAGSGPAEHCFPSRPAGQRATHSEGRVCTLASTGNTTSGESKPDSK